MLGWLKKFRHKDDEYDYDDIKSGVLGKNDYYEPAMNEPMPAERFEPSRPESASMAQAGRFGEPLSMPMGPEPFSSGTKTNRDYDILDKLNLIETNLLAIRSQTETINERLKNLEMKLTPRRY